MENKDERTAEPKTAKPRFKSKNFERWAEIKGHTNYLASNYGRIRNKRNNYILKPYYPNKDSRYFNVKIDGENMRVNRIIANAFIPNPEMKPIVHHKDTNSTNNCADNLQWVTQSEHREIHKKINEKRKKEGERNEQGNS